ncbi:MAG TPA: TIGR03668 family PPOX class F420-dependent oxidoreductase [Thermoleophilaceae bacterium]
MTLPELPGWALSLVDSARVARLAFADPSGAPRVLPVTFAVVDGDVWSAIDRKPKRTPEPARVRYLRERPAAALCVDRYDDDWSRLAWVQLLGQVSVLGAGDGAAAMEALVAKYAQYRSERPPGPLLRLRVERALSWRAAAPGR